MGPPQLMTRASDLDRQRAVEILKDAAAKGYLSLGDFEERLGIALGASHLEDLDPLLADLPGTPTPSASWASPTAAIYPRPRTSGARRGPTTAAALTLIMALAVAAALGTLLSGLWFPPLPLVVVGLVVWHRRHHCPMTRSPVV